MPYLEHSRESTSFHHVSPVVQRLPEPQLFFDCVLREVLPTKFLWQGKICCFFSTKILWMEEILHQLIGGQNPIICRVSTIQGGAGFLPPTVCWGFNQISCMLPTRYVSLRNIQMIQMDPENLGGALRLKLHGDMTIFNSKLIRIVCIYII